MTLIELQEVLGERIAVTLNDELTTEERKIENEQSAIVIGLAKQIKSLGYERNTIELKMRKRWLKSSHHLKSIS